MYQHPPIAATEIAPGVLFSSEALRRAWCIVRKHGPSAGSDRITMLQFEHALDSEIFQLRAELINETYRPLPVQRFYKVKSSGKRRALTIWAIRDRVAQRVVLDFLTPFCEAVFLDCSYGFRPGRRVEDAIHAVEGAIASGLRWVVDADIADCFDSIPIRLMQAQVEQHVRSRIIRRLIGQWLCTPVAGKPGQLAGVTQGGVISPLLTNLYLHRFDQIVTSSLPAARLVRFADDFVILCRRKQEAARALELCRSALELLNMNVNPSKTQVICADRGLVFLGKRIGAASVHSPAAGINRQEESPS